ncbi:MAG: hypothetical protein ABIB98_02730 [bacterium]
MQNIIINNTDDLYTLAEILQSNEAEEFVFVIPSGINIFNNPISFKFLERQAELLGKKVSFVNEKNEPLLLVNAETNFLSGGEKEDDVKVNTGSKIEIFGIFKNAIILIFGSLLFIGLVGGLWWVGPKATVVLNTNSEMLVKNIEITANANVSKVSESDKEIPAVVLEAIRKGTESIQTSGEKEVGEKAKGTVKIYNKTTSKKTFSAGTKLILTSSPDSLIYYTLEEVILEERQDLPAGITYGISEVEVEAGEFGPGYNISENQNFDVDDHNTSDFSAQNEKEFTGGTSKKVLAVSEKDKEALLQVLEERLKTEVSTDLELKLVGQQKLAESSISFETFDTVFDKNVGDEADKLNLTLQVKAYSLAYYQNDLETVVKSVLERSIPEQYSLSDTETRFEIGAVIADKPPSSKEKLVLLVKVRSFVVPKISEQDIKDNITAKSIKSAQEYLDTLKNVPSYELIVWPKLPGFLNTMPHLKSRISVEIKSE